MIGSSRSHSVRGRRVPFEVVVDARFDNAADRPRDPGLGFSCRRSAARWRQVVEAAFSVAMADGEFDEPEQDLLMEIADAMHMSAAHARGVISNLVDRLQLAADGEPDEPDEAQGEAW